MTHSLRFTTRRTTGDDRIGFSYEKLVEVVSGFQTPAIFVMQALPYGDQFCNVASPENLVEFGEGRGQAHPETGFYRVSELRLTFSSSASLEAADAAIEQDASLLCLEMTAIDSGWSAPVVTVVP
jgi:hypothetical protein